MLFCSEFCSEFRCFSLPARLTTSTAPRIHSEINYSWILIFCMNDRCGHRHSAFLAERQKSAKAERACVASNPSNAPNRQVKRANKAQRNGREAATYYSLVHPPRLSRRTDENEQSETPRACVSLPVLSATHSTPTSLSLRSSLHLDSRSKYDVSCIWWKRPPLDLLHSASPKHNTGCEERRLHVEISTCYQHSNSGPVIIHQHHTNQGHHGLSHKRY